MAQSTLGIYPNPAIELVYIDVEGNLQYEADLYGTLIMTASNTNRLDVGTLPSSMYILGIRDVQSTQRIVEKIIVGQLKALEESKKTIGINVGGLGCR